MDYVKVKTWNAHTITAVSNDNRAFNHRLSADTNCSECLIRVYRLPNSDINTNMSTSIFACKLIKGTDGVGFVWNVSSFNGKLKQTYTANRRRSVEGLA